MIDILVLNEDFELSGVLDLYESFIWTERYSECGDFEFYSHASADIIDLVHPGMYLQIAGSDRNMLIEAVTLEHDFENGDHIKVTGRSLECLLERRIIWKPVVYKNITLASLIKTIVYKNLIDPDDSVRKVNNFIFYEPVDSKFPNPTFKSIELHGENLYDVISTLCKTYKAGFKVVREGGNFVLYLYGGEDRSYDQDINPYVVFSPNYDNILSSNYVDSIENYKTSCLVGGEGEGLEQIIVEAKLTTESGTDLTGFDRREVYLDQSSITRKQTIIDETTGQETERELTMEEYQALLFEKGSKALSENIREQLFDAEVDPMQLYEYNVDYRIGDVVQMVNDYGMEATTRVTEYIRSCDSNGISAYPTFASDVTSDDYSEVDWEY